MHPMAKRGLACLSALPIAVLLPSPEALFAVPLTHFQAISLIPPILPNIHANWPSNGTPKKPPNVFIFAIFSWPGSKPKTVAQLTAIATTLPHCLETRLSSLEASARSCQPLPPPPSFPAAQLPKWPWAKVGRLVGHQLDPSQCCCF